MKKKNQNAVSKATNEKLEKWNDWFAGFMDGDGSILVNNNHVSIEATTSIEDEGILNEIKKKFGGSIKPRSNARALRWRSRKKVVVEQVLNTLKGRLYNNIRQEQVKKACALYSIEYKETKKEISPEQVMNWSYLTGLFDADGTVSISCINPADEKHRAKKRKEANKKEQEQENKENERKIYRATRPGKPLEEKIQGKELINIPGTYGKVVRLINSREQNQCVLKCTNQYKENIEVFKKLGIGDIYEETKPHKKWHWIIKSTEIQIFLNYLKENPLKGQKKKNRVHLIPEYIRLKGMKAHLADQESVLFKEWKKFCYKWYNWVEP